MMSGKEPLPRRNPLLTMAKYMSDAGSDGYSGLTMLYHHTTTQLIIQWTGTHISQSEKVEFEQSLLKLLKGCEGESNEDLEHLEYEEQETGMDMADDHATSEMDSSYTEHTDADYVVKQEPEEIICTNSSDEPTIPYSSVPLEFSTSDSATAADEPTIPHSSAPLEFSVSDSATSTTDVVNQQLVMTSKSRKKDVTAPLYKAPVPYKSRRRGTYQHPVHLSPTTKRLIDITLDHSSQGSCSLCTYSTWKYTTIKRHIFEHFTNVFCACGYHSVAIDTVSKHIRFSKYNNCGRLPYRVDADSFESWKAAMGLPNEIVFPPVRPKTKEPDKGATIRLQLV